MGGVIFWLATKSGFSQKVVKFGLIALLVVAAVGGFMLWLDGQKDGAVKADRDAANVKILTTDTKAQSNAATERANDTINISTEEGKRHEAIHSEPSKGAPDASRIRLNCQRLARQGSPPPEVCK